jgi:hypothetical protein
MSAVTWLLSLSGLTALPLTAEAADEIVRRSPVPADAVARVVAAVREAAERNARLPVPVAGDDLTELYVRSAATAARTLPADQAVPAFLVALGIALDHTTLLRKNPATALLARGAETADERAKRLAVLGRPTVHGRRDLCQHFAVSCTVTAVIGAGLTEAAGLLKEMTDADGGTGFSFADMAANLSGIRLATRMTDGRPTLDEIAKDFRVVRYVPAVFGFPEGISLDRFRRDYGSTDDPRFKAEMEAVRSRLRKLDAE